MSLRILCAGCSKPEREAVEAEVAAALGTRARNDPWTVSLVKIGDRWSVTLEGPDRATRGTAFMAPRTRLRESIAEALGKGAPAAAVAAPASAAPAGASPARAAPASAAPRSPRPASPVVSGPRGERRDRHDCSKCRKSYVIVYDAEAGEATETVPVACPRCWQIDHVAVAQSAGLSADYRVEKVD
jgi:hypothetical protein